MNIDSGSGIIPLFAIFCIFGLPLLYAIVNRILSHHERLEMLRRGVMPPPDSRWARRAARAGWYDPAAYGMQPGAYPPGYDPYSLYRANASLRKGISVAMIGLALFIGLSFIKPGEPGPWLLGGLIPLFVGIAQIIIALLAGARLGPFGLGMQPPPGIGGQSSQPGAASQAPPPFGGRGTPTAPYGWRPGPTTELEPPAGPPDLR